LSLKEKYLIGIEGGGTKSSAILTNEKGKIISQANGSVTNPNVVGFEKSAKNIVSLISILNKKAKCSLKNISSIVIGTAGAGNKSNQSQLKKELQKYFRKEKSLPKIKITSDAEIAVEAALGKESGIVLIAGTGSILFGKGYLQRMTNDQLRMTNNEYPMFNVECRSFRIGGWGKILGDEGSGFVIARDALKEVVSSFDRKTPSTVLTKSALKFFSAKSVEELPSKIINGKKEIPAFAPNVIQLASKKDFQSLFVVEFHCNALLQQLHLMMNNFPGVDKLPIVLLGGLLENENFYSRMLKEKIKQYFPQLEIMKPKFPAVYGAILLSLKSK